MKYKLSLGGTTYEVEVEKGEAILVDSYATASAPVAAPIAAPAAAPVASSAPAAAPVSGGSLTISCPMPGTILSIKVAVGERVKRGQILLILEAMKMENEIVAPEDGVVGAISVTQGQTVDTGATLIVFGTPGVVAAPAAPVAPVTAPAAAPVAAPVAAPAPAGGEPVVCPMPGTILSIKVAVGQTVKRGQILLILEAMKMENEIVAAHDGVVSHIAVTQGASVDTGTLLLTLS